MVQISHLLRVDFLAGRRPHYLHDLSVVERCHWPFLGIGWVPGLFEIHHHFVLLLVIHRENTKRIFVVLFVLMRDHKVRCLQIISNDLLETLQRAY